MRFDTTTRVLHYCLIITVVFQLLSSEFMMVSEPGKMTGFRTMLFDFHMMFFGWGAFLISSVYAMILYQDKDEWRRLVPWFSATHRAALFKSIRDDVSGIFRGHLAPPEERGALAGAIHGFGILLLIAQGFTGAYVMLGVRSDGTMRADTLLFLDFHSFFGVLLWIFLIGHVSMFICHLLFGHRTILDVFQRVNIPWK